MNEEILRAKVNHFRERARTANAMASDQEVEIEEYEQQIRELVVSSSKLRAKAEECIFCADALYPLPD